MKLSLSALTVGLFVASAAADPFSNLNLLARNFGVLDVTNMAPYVTQCSDTYFVGKLEGFVVVDADGNTCSSQPCCIEQGKRYGVIYILGCGDTENYYTLEVTMDEEPEYSIPQHTGGACNYKGELVTVTFVFDTPSSATNGVHYFRFRLVGSSYKNESCIKDFLFNTTTQGCY